jgi:hypothetical protein
MRHRRGEAHVYAALPIRDAASVGQFSTRSRRWRAARISRASCSRRRSSSGGLAGLRARRLRALRRRARLSGLGYSVFYAKTVNPERAGS